MKNHGLALLIVFLQLSSSLAAWSQGPGDSYAGQWEGEFADDDIFEFELFLSLKGSDQMELVLYREGFLLAKAVPLNTSQPFEIELAEDLVFRGEFDTNQRLVRGFLRSGVLLYHLVLDSQFSFPYSTVWSPLMLSKLQSKKLYLDFGKNEGEAFHAYPFWGDTRFSGTWCGDFLIDGESYTWRDAKTGLAFQAALNSEEIKLEILLGGNKICELPLTRSENDWDLRPQHREIPKKPPVLQVLNDSWEVSDLSSAGFDKSLFQEMEDSIYAEKLTHTHGITIAHKGKLVYERYFYGFNSYLYHDQRSASKSIASAMMGIAINQGVFHSESQAIYPLLPKAYLATQTPSKAKITIEDLLNMSAGLDALDFGSDTPSAASEGAYQNSRDWFQTILQAPVIHEAGTHANYGSANPALLGLLLDHQIEQDLADYMDETLFAPLGIDRYIIQTDNTGRPYFGGGMYLRPRDMLKFGQLYLNIGLWQGKRVLPAAWVESSMVNRFVLENTRNKNGYGYLWWHDDYEIGDRKIHSIEARGSGGQYIALIPECDLVVAITSGNFRNGRFWQPEKIIESYILPALLEN